MENKKPIEGHVIFFCFLILVILCTFMGKVVFGLAGTSVGDYLLEQGTPVEKAPTIVANKEIPYVEPPKVVKVVETKPIEKKPVVAPVEVKEYKCTSKVRLDLVNHAYKISGGDMKFVGTIASESMFDVNSVGDGGKSLGLCQFHRGYQPDNWKAYQTLESDFAKLEFCHEKYSIWKKKGILHRRLYGYNVYEKGLEKLEISCK